MILGVTHRLRACSLPYGNPQSGCEEELDPEPGKPNSGGDGKRGYLLLPRLAVLTLDCREGVEKCNDCS